MASEVTVDAPSKADWDALLDLAGQELRAWHDSRDTRHQARFAPLWENLTRWESLVEALHADVTRQLDTREPRSQRQSDVGEHLHWVRKAQGWQRLVAERLQEIRYLAAEARRTDGTVALEQLADAVQAAHQEADRGADVVGVPRQRWDDIVGALARARMVGV